jgi:flavodoxin I
MKKIGLFYSFNTRKSGIVADKIASELGKNNVELVNAEEIDEEKFLSYDNIIISAPTWFDGELPNYWDEFVPALEDLDLKGKTIALFGLGDQKGYPENFVDAIGIMAEILEKKGAKLIGQTSTEGYTFEKSKAVRDGKFLGLAIDADTQNKLTDKRVKDWVEGIKDKFK